MRVATRRAAYTVWNKYAMTKSQTAGTSLDFLHSCRQSCRGARGGGTERSHSDHWRCKNATRSSIVTFRIELKTHWNFAGESV